MKAFLVVTLLVTGALAMGQGNNMPSYSDFDSDGNGKITQKEFKYTQQKRQQIQSKSGKLMRNANNATSFSSIDTNDDGIIDKEEFTSHQSNNRGTRGKGRYQ